jgi:hypothetical protein
MSSSMFWKLEGVEFTKPAQATAAAEQFVNFKAVVAPYKRCRPDGSTEVVWALRVPGGLRPDTVQKYLRQQHPAAKWALVSIDEDGFEVALQPA